ncbi:hypothetical protein [Sinisalibacter lacisalsi]|uniref:Flagellum-specific ATP synthase FliI n=1 Tax=Sinisalibacter lacisalsi TaxID=1526570 RepID=A0ABQ1QNE2_9RHOB|nr:hypothetical protein [Sinisalibacter lacisalsi]GGD33187.1 hypothetical protein GCM10011358_16620 [Sinisalibacter lacisalsi]
MTRTRAHGGAPNAFVAENATRRGVIPLDEVALLGVAGPQGAMRAIIRMSDGDIVTGALGERIALGELVEVSPAGVVIEMANGFAAFLRPYPWGQDRAPG